MKEQRLQHTLARIGAITELASRIEAIERKHARAHDRKVATRLPAPLDCLRSSVLHEWFAQDDGGASGTWATPMLLLAYLARCGSEASSSGLLLWIGRRVWPQPHMLQLSWDQKPRRREGAEIAFDVRESDSESITSPPRLGGSAVIPHERNLLRRSLLVDPPTFDDRLWAIDLCLRSPAVVTVVADASALRIAHGRRLQLAAEAGRALALFARPEKELAIPSVAATRWRVRPTPSSAEQAGPRWEVQLVRSKGAQRVNGMEANITIALEHDHATGGFHIPADVADRSLTSATSEKSICVRRTG